MNKQRIVVLFVVVAMVLASAGTGLAFLLSGDENDEFEPLPTEPTGDAAPEPREEDPDARTAPDPALQAFYDQEIAWEGCGSGKECGALEVPVDYREPDGETFELNLLRVLAQGDAIGSMVVNPGGPGAPGTSYADAAGRVFQAPVRARYDVVGFDPRGTGESSPIDCLSDAEVNDYIASDPDPDSLEEAEQVAEDQRAFFEGCVENSGPLIGHVTTIETARDMDVLRAALGEGELTYFGASYGTKLGATYAELFPKHVGRFVLDGAVDPSLPSIELSLGQAEGFQRALTAYVDNCVEATPNCFLGDDTEEGLATIQSLLEDIEAEPLPTSQGDRELTIGNAFYGLVTPLYNRDFWTILSQALRSGIDGDGTALLLLSDVYASREGDTYNDNSIEAILAINCIDDPFALGPEESQDEIERFTDVSPTFGRIFAWGQMGCLGIQVESVEKQLKIRAKGAAPILVTGTTRDPATPYEWAVGLAEQLESAVLITRDGDGHTAYNAGNACVDEAINAYLVDGTVPQADVDC